MSKRKKPAPAATAPSTQPERTLLALLNLPGIGRKTVHRLIATAGRIDSLEALLVDQASDFDKSQLAAAYKARRRYPRRRGGDMLPVGVDAFCARVRSRKGFR